MHKNIFILFVCNLVLLAQGDVKVDIPINPSTLIPTDSSVVPVTTTTSPTSKPTIVPPAPTTPIPPTTSTTKTNTTTTSTTTPKPTTSTIPSTTTRKPSDDPPINHFDVLGNNSSYCLMMNVSIEVEILGNNSSNSSKVKVPANPTFIGNCSDPTESLTISWQNNEIDFYFELIKAQKYEFKMIDVTINNTQYAYQKTAFPASTSESYKCDKVQILDLIGKKSNKTEARLHISHLQYQAFMNTTKQQFDAPWDCAGANTSDVVPIVVGCILAVLVVLILVAYLFGRRRCQARGYLSM